MGSQPSSGVIRKLSSLADQWRQRHLRNEFRLDPERAKKFSMKIGGLFVDFSKNHIDDETASTLLEFADAIDFLDWRQRMFAGEAINNTENRAAWHVGLRDIDLLTDDLRKSVEQQRAREQEVITTARQAGRFTNVINLGIGGSQLGPELVCDALSSVHSPEIRPHFLAHTDPRTRDELLASLDPASTLVIIASKSFMTVETRLNATAVLEWLSGGGTEARRIAEQVFAVTSNTSAAGELGIAANHCFTMPDWVGGRYSTWSAIGLPIAIAFGYPALVELRTGAREIDQHFLSAAPAENLPLQLGLLDAWYINFLSCQARAILVYNAGLKRLPDYLQQLIMESCGKSVQRDGAPADTDTAPVVWGGIGQTGQHAYFQLLHQGSRVVPVDFIFAKDPECANDPGYLDLAANFIAQAEALMCGMTADEVAAGGVEPELVAHKTFPGNRPSTSVLLDRLDANCLGQLIALYEHRTFVQSLCWNINPFDQMGVELGKNLAGDVKALFAGDDDDAHDSSTRELARQMQILIREGQ